MTVSLDPAVDESPRNPATPLPRLIAVMLSSNVGALIALLTPLQLLLTLQTTRIAGDGAAAAFGVITGVGALFALVANPLAGRISDRTAARFGRRRTWILTGAIGGALAVFALGFTTEIWQVVIVWSITQTLFNFQQAATSALLADQVPPLRRGTVSGFIGLAAALGPLLGIAAVSAITDPLVQWGVIAVVSVVLGLLAVALLRDPQHVPAQGQAGLGLVELLKSFWLNPRKHPAFGWAWLVRFLITCAYASGTYNAFYLMDRFGIAPEAVGGAVLLLSLISVGLLAVTSVVAGPISDRLRRQKPFVVAAGVLAAGSLVLLALAPSLEIVYLAVGVLGVGTGLFFSIDSALCVRVLPSAENAGKDFAIINMANTIPQSFVPFIAPFLLAVGGFTALYVTLALFGILGALAVLRIPEIGWEGDSRWAQITRAVSPARVPVP
ncbi:MFS transporter [Herbiconiux sp. L3-i23]|uniref:MFS transporter n=1 Tax=Herbiconiux sp. L3-i23 TaxID=2905871 RepID=UPI0020534B03|nr:MFS transporter [Herbiconiux sp. L3-i23]BDI22333.1 MFS transporter [Herbiconiux sp. L3-i23]